MKIFYIQVLTVCNMKLKEDICIMQKSNNFIKPPNIQIISKYPFERIKIDITFFKNKLEFCELKNKYLPNFIDQFSKYTKFYLIDDKTSVTVLSKFKYIK